MDNPRTSTPLHRNDEERRLRDARRQRAYGYLQINTAAVRAAFEHVETPKIKLPHKGLNPHQ